MNHNMIEAFIFDLDDTIVRSERLNVELIFRCFKEKWDVELDKEDEEYVFGHSWQSIYQFMIEKYRLPISIDDVQNAMLLMKQDYLKTHRLEQATGMSELLKMPQRKVIVSGSGKGEIEMMLKNIGIESYFEDWFAIEEYGKGKPEPDGFLMALNYLQLPANRTIAFEDSKSGLKSAKKAGIHTIFIKEFAEHDYSELADADFDTFEDFIRKFNSDTF